MRMLTIALAFCTFCTAAGASQNPWATLTAGDLRAVHDILQENHPGPVDPQNTKFRIWLDDGLKQSLVRAQTARSIDDYERALLFYKNGFEDGHIGVWFNVLPRSLNWPGFVLWATSTRDVEVIYAEPDAGVSKGARLLSCDGEDVDKLLAKRTDPYRSNIAVPHDRYYWINYLFQMDAADNQPKVKTCAFSSGSVALHWRVGDYAEVHKTYDDAMGLPQKPTLRQVEGVWLVSIPTFDFESKAEIAGVKSFIAELESKAAALRQATIIIDVRGNRGGNSGWGQQMAEALWGKPLADYFVNKLDWTVDWRVSQSNIDQLNKAIAYGRAAGDDISGTLTLRDKMVLALQQHEALVRDDGAPKPAGPMPPDPIKGRVYFLTDMACASACLDFADVVRQMPHVMHVGLPTYADSVYMDTNSKPLPSGLGNLGYGMKVYRHRIRGNNQWYEPQIRWPGGPMNGDAEIVRWIRSLH